jgi:hypothetical protein
MQQLKRSPAPRAQNERVSIANLSDVRPAAPKVEPASMGGIDVPAALRKRPFAALLILMLTLMAGAPYLLRKAPKEYHAEAAIYVSPTYFKNLQQDREQLQISYSTLVNQQILTLRRYDILHEALVRLERQGIRWRQPAESDEAAVARLTKDLDVQHIPDSYEVLVGLDAAEREWVAPIVNTVADSYLEKGKADDLADRTSRISALTMEQANLQEQLQAKLEEQSRLSQDLMTVSLDKATPVDDTLLAGARQAQEDARHKRMEAEAQYRQESLDGGGGGIRIERCESPRYHQQLDLAEIGTPSENPGLDAAAPPSSSQRKRYRGHQRPTNPFARGPGGGCLIKVTDETPCRS